MPAESPVTSLLQAAACGDEQALHRLAPLVYEELHRMARRLLKDGPRGRTLQTTALVHEAYLKLVGGKEISWESKSHFFGVAAKAMRCILVDHARARLAAKRGSGQRPTALDEALAVFEDRRLDVLAIDEALGRLAEHDDRKARVVELRFFAGLSAPETAELLGVSLPTVERDWRFAQAWLRRELREDEPQDHEGKRA